MREELRHKILNLLTYLMIIISSGAFVQLIKDGGAREQGFSALNQYSGPLDYLPIFWQFAVAVVIGIFFIEKLWSNIQFDLVWGSVIALCLASVIWTTFPLVSLLSSVMLLLSYLLVNIHVGICGWQKVLASLNRLFSSILILSLLAIFLLPSFGVSIGEHAGKWQGVFTHKNALGNFAAMLYVFYLWWSTIERTPAKLVCAGMSLVLVVGSFSSTALINLTVCTLLYGLLRLPLTRKLLFAQRFVVVCALGLSIYYIMVNSLNSSGFLILDKDSSFSNRNLIWAYFLEEIESAPWIGHGLNQFSVALSFNESDFLSRVGFVVGSAHNGYLECWYALGIVGLVLTLAAILQPMRLKIDGYPSELAFLLVLFILILNTFESQLLGFNPYFIMLMYVASLTRAMSQQSVSQTLD